MMRIGTGSDGKPFTLPQEAITNTFGVLAVRGAGKTYTALVMAEEMISAGLPVVVIDPVGVCWGLRSSADGKSAGLKVIVLGGDHGDVPLAETSGQVIADWIIADRAPCVLDLSLFRKAAARRFMADFAERLYHKNRQPVHLIMDEADAFAPQRPDKGAERLLGAIEDLVRRGRARGIGLTMMTQRAAVLNKNVLTQIETLVVLRTMSPQDRKAMDEWVTAHGTAEQRDQLMESVSALPNGTAWFWSPQFLRCFERVKIRQRVTFDSSRTPKAGDRRVEPAARAKVDLDQLSKAIAATIEEHRANDPTELKRQVAELRRKLADSESIVADLAKVRDGAVETADRLHGIAAALRDRVAALSRRIATIRDAAADDNWTEPEHVATIPGRVPKRNNAAVVGSHVPSRNGPTPAPRVATQRSDAGDLTRYQSDLLNVCLTRYPLPTPRAQLAALAHKSHKSSAFGPNLRALVEAGLVEEQARGFAATETAVASHGRGDAPTGRAALDYWCSKLPKQAGQILRVIADGGVLSLESVAERSGYSMTSSAFRPAIRNLVEASFIRADESGYTLGDVFAE